MKIPSSSTSRSRDLQFGNVAALLTEYKASSSIQSAFKAALVNTCEIPRGLLGTSTSTCANHTSTSQVGRSKHQTALNKDTLRLLVSTSRTCYKRCHRPVKTKIEKKRSFFERMLSPCAKDLYTCRKKSVMDPMGEEDRELCLAQLTHLQSAFAFENRLFHSTCT